MVLAETGVVMVVEAARVMLVDGTRRIKYVFEEQDWPTRRLDLV